MTKLPVVDVAASVRQRLLNKSRRSGRPFNEWLQYFAMERFLYRLSKSSYASSFIIKGATMFAVWGAPISRPTRDIDLLGRTRNEVDDLVNVIKDICVQEVEPDGLLFDADSVEGQRIIETAAYEGVRVRFRGTLGAARIFMQVDVAFGDVVVPEPVTVDYPTILGMPAPRLDGYTRESAIAEKFEAMVRLGIVNSRMKDFFDIWLLSTQFDFDGETLAEAIKQTFAHRETDIASQPVALTEAFTKDSSKQAQWSAFLRRTRIVDAPNELANVIELVSLFLLPVSNALASGDTFDRTWSAPGPWS
ncbi:MAG TPA: nucleotidyl transferase AbiEii/AbiGii toxin family protein [bacterium]|nr:nucleotidyl transferase AbiEii/AbiGii toxin family protein [bacterium]